MSFGQGRQGRASTLGGLFSPSGSRRKYRNVRRAATPGDPGSEYNGRVYDSKAQAAYAAQLDQEQQAGLIKSWIPEVSFPLPGLNDGTRDTRIRVDFMVLDHDNRISLRDVKGGIVTEAWKLKARALANALGVEVEIVRPRRR